MNASHESKLQRLKYAMMECVSWHPFARFFRGCHYAPSPEYLHAEQGEYHEEEKYEEKQRYYAPQTAHQGDGQITQGQPVTEIPVTQGQSRYCGSSIMGECIPTATGNECLEKTGHCHGRLCGLIRKYRNVLLLELHKRRDLILGTFRTTEKVFYLQNARIQLIGEKVCTSWCISLLGNKLPETDKLVGMTPESMSGRENFFMYSKNCQFWRRKKWNILWARVRSKCCRNLKDRKNLSVSQNER